ncbi:MAG: hypothetical protein V9G19_16235 [Tetrasphaera sp.]
MNGKTLALISVTTLLAWLPPATATPSVLDNGYCQNGFAGMVKFEFQGPGTAWSTGSNWVGGLAPTNANSANGYVCIPSGKSVVMAPGESARVQAIDVDAGASLELAVAAKLYANGDKTVLTSYLRSGSLVRWSGTLGGTGAILASGALKWERDPSSASALQSRPCAATRSCTMNLAPGAEGALTVTDSGVLDVAETARQRGVNLSDQYQLQVRGQLTIHGSAYVAQDYGSAIELSPQSANPALVGELAFDGDGSVYDGWTSATLARGKLVNGGSISKPSGTGASVIAVDYQKTATGGANVDVGQLSLPDTTPTKTDVLAAATIATGKCAGEGCRPEVNTSDPVAVSVQAPGVDPDGADVTITETTETGPAGSFASPVWVQVAGELTTTSTSAAVLTLRFDKTLLSGKGITAANKIAIWRKEDTAGATFVKIGPCSNGAIPVGQTSCVDRRAAWTKIFSNTDSTVANRGDAQVTVRTTTFSRWVARNDALT